jgi:hypothetical protein
VTPGELHVDLRERVLVRVAAADEAVVDRDEVKRDRHEDNQDDPAHLRDLQ